MIRKKKKSELTNSKRMELELDELWAKSVKERDNYRCQWCKYTGVARGGSDAHHITARSLGRILRWVLQNGVTLCRYHHSFGLMHEPAEYKEFICWFLGGGRREIGKRIYSELQLTSQQIKRFTLEELGQMLDGRLGRSGEINGEAALDGGREDCQA